MGRTESAAWPTCRLREEPGRDGLNYLEKEGRGWLNPHLFPSSKATTGRYTAGGERPDWHNLDSFQNLGRRRPNSYVRSGGASEAVG